MKRLVLIMLAVCGCGVETPSTPAASHSSQALHCDTEATLNANGSATKLSCPFEQQLANIKANGGALTSPLMSAGQAVAFTSSMECDSWVMGNDVNGVQVFVNTADGTVRSHGAVHAGFATTVLPAQLAQPLSLDR